jgi:NAD(P)-dependent dehydrogenase (short-subunit alcohol dehydrogenase family)
LFDRLTNYTLPVTRWRLFNTKYGTGRLVQRDSCSVAVITGGASGLGEATARLLASKGVKVAIFDLNGARGNDLATELGGVFCEVNVTSDDSVDAGFAKARAAIGQERIQSRSGAFGRSHSHGAALIQ